MDHVPSFLTKALVEALVGALVGALVEALVEGIVGMISAEGRHQLKQSLTAKMP